eukprot:TRINITY_DN33204_c0_g1_i1.p1 TRINITY_DN33204_c0_g1~~TRINITY_DN33204_c0_g1_i1.p1  ORF type:complete len:535 (-),score=78.42 TRINITY_DN33204_c0_g1_i1:45-1649(-)
MVALALIIENDDDDDAEVRSLMSPRNIPGQRASITPATPSGDRDKSFQRKKRWFKPSRIRLSEVDPRRRRANGEGRMHGEVSSKSSCQRFQSSCQSAGLSTTALLADSRQYLMSFAASKMVTSAPRMEAESGGWHRELSSESSDDGLSASLQEDMSESGESEVSEDDSKTTSTQQKNQTSDRSSFAENPLSDIASSGSVTTSDEEDDNEMFRKISRGSHNAANRAQTRHRTLVQPKQGSNGAKMDHSSAVALFLCSRKNHPQFLFEKIYTPRCVELGVQINSGVQRKLLYGGGCLCNLESLNVANMLIGDRGIRAVLPLLRSARRLKSLNLSGNRLREAGLRDCLKCLEDPDTCGSLAVLDVSHNPISSPSAPDLVSLLNNRRSILILGMYGTAMPNVRRQHLLRRSLATFAQAPTSEMCQAWQLSSPGSGFSDPEAWVQCASVVESSCSREQLAVCMELVSKCKVSTTPSSFSRQTTGQSTEEPLSPGLITNQQKSTASSASTRAAHTKSRSPESSVSSFADFDPKRSINSVH